MRPSALHPTHPTQPPLASPPPPAVSHSRVLHGRAARTARLLAPRQARVFYSGPAPSGAGLRQSRRSCPSSPAPPANTELRQTGAPPPGTACRAAGGGSPHPHACTVTASAAGRRSSQPAVACRSKGRLSVPAQERGP